MTKIKKLQVKEEPQMELPSFMDDKGTLDLDKVDGFTLTLRSKEGKHYLIGPKSKSEITDAQSIARTTFIQLTKSILDSGMFAVYVPSIEEMQAPPKDSK